MELVSLRTTDLVPPNYHTKLPVFTQQLKDIFACGDADHYRQQYVHCLVMSCIAQPQNGHAKTAHRLRCRILLEQANPVSDLTTWLTRIPAGCSPDVHTMASNLLHESSKFKENGEFSVPDWSNWPDLRWIPGARQSVETQESDWDR